MSGFAILIGCWILLHLHVRQLSRRQMLLELAFLAAFAFAASLFVAWHLSLTKTDTLDVWAMLFAFSLAAAVIVNAMKQRLRAGPMSSVTQGLTQSENLQSYLDGLRERDLGCYLLDQHDLSDFSSEKLITELRSDGAIDFSDLPKQVDDDTMSQSQIRTLLKRYGGTQAYLVAADPLHIAIGQSNNIAENLDKELLAAFGLARLIAERDALRNQQ